MRADVRLVHAIFSFCHVEYIRFYREQNIYQILSHKLDQTCFPTLTENRIIRRMTFALRSLNQKSQSESRDVGTRTGSAAKQQYFPFCLFTGCRSLSPAPTTSSQTLNISTHLHPPAKIFVFFRLQILERHHKATMYTT